MPSHRQSTDSSPRRMPSTLQGSSLPSSNSPSLRPNLAPLRSYLASLPLHPQPTQQREGTGSLPLSTGHLTCRMPPQCSPHKIPPGPSPSFPTYRSPVPPALLLLRLVTGPPLHLLSNSAPAPPGDSGSFHLSSVLTTSQQDMLEKFDASTGAGRSSTASPTLIPPHDPSIISVTLPQ